MLWVDSTAWARRGGRARNWLCAGARQATYRAYRARQDDCRAEISAVRYTGTSARDVTKRYRRDKGEGASCLCACAVVRAERRSITPDNNGANAFRPRVDRTLRLCSAEKEFVKESDKIKCDHKISTFTRNFWSGMDMEIIFGSSTSQRGKCLDG